MRFGIFYEHQLPRPWGAGDEHRLLKDALDQVELADRLGIDYVWEVEHHFPEECVPAGFAVNPAVACVLPFMCHHDEEVAVERGLDGGHFFAYSLAHYYVFGAHRPGHTVLWDEFQANRAAFGFDREIASRTGQPLGAQVLEEGGLGSLRGAIGTPDQVRELVRRYEAAGVDQLIFVAQAGRNRHEHVCESLELFAAEVLPEFAARADGLERAKQDRLATAVEAALARRPPPRTAPEGYSVPATPNF